ncbi:HEPN domain-containing protein [Candidatus Micrarchaeota archaeon]|nr:HEPN domain-containing protein [Candidatus Micrarchaeota archaeon]
MTEIEECFAKGMLKKTKSDMGKAMLSLKVSGENLEDARSQLENGLFKWAFIAAYTSMFHAARALLYRDGVKERSHFCLCAYVKERYRGTIEARYISELNILREQRHRIMYGDENIKTKEVEEVEAESAVAIAAGFLEAVEKIIKK